MIVLAKVGVGEGSVRMLSLRQRWCVAVAAVVPTRHLQTQAGAIAPETKEVNVSGSRDGGNGNTAYRILMENLYKCTRSNDTNKTGT